MLSDMTALNISGKSVRTSIFMVCEPIPCPFIRRFEKACPLLLTGRLPRFYPIPGPSRGSMSAVCVYATYVTRSTGEG